MFKSAGAKRVADKLKANFWDRNTTLELGTEDALQLATLGGFFRVAKVPWRADISKMYRLLHSELENNVCVLPLLHFCFDVM